MSLSSMPAASAAWIATGAMALVAQRKTVWPSWKK